MNHYKVIYKVGESLQEKTIYAKNKIDACTRFVACYHYHVVEVIPVHRPGNSNALVA